MRVFDKKTEVIFFVVLALCSLKTTSKKCIFSKRYEVEILNNIGPVAEFAVKVHCKSGEDDLGTRILSWNEKFNWSFCENIFHGTLYFCHFDWGSKTRTFDAFNSSLRSRCSSAGWCGWETNDDGIYFDDGYGSTWLVYEWQ